MRTVCIGLLLGGGLVVLGATLPWLTLFAGLQPYAGTTGTYGWLMLGAGSIACVMAFATRRQPLMRVCAGSIVYGLGILVFAVWLLAGLDEIVHRPDALMLVPRAGPGLYVIVAGAATLVFSSAAEAVIVHRYVRR